MMHASLKENLAWASLDITQGTVELEMHVRVPVG